MRRNFLIGELRINIMLILNSPIRMLHIWGTLWKEKSPILQLNKYTTLHDTAKIVTTYNKGKVFRDHMRYSHTND